MSLSTLAGQQQHYSAVRARLRGPAPVTRVRLAQVALPAPEEADKPAKPIPFAGVAKGSWGGTWRKDEAEAIIAETAAKHGVSVEEIRSPLRATKILMARFETYYRIQTELGYSLNMIGITLNKEHTGVLNGIRRHKARTGAGQ